MQDMIETIAAMRFQEDTGYLTKDWTKTCVVPLHCEAIDMECRDHMAAWCISVVDFCKFRRETVEIALSYVDRFLITPAGDSARNSRSIYRLLCMTALYTAVKIHEPTAMDPRFVARLSHGAYSPEEIEAMEGHLLQALKWRVNPPTSMAFVRSAINMIPESALSSEMRQAALEVAQIQADLAMCKSDLITVQASTVAYCALVNSLESLGLDLKVHGSICDILLQALQLSDGAAVDKVQRILYESVNQQPTKRERSQSLCNIQSEAKHTKHKDSVELSPRSISVPQ